MAVGTRKVDLEKESTPESKKVALAIQKSIAKTGCGTSKFNLEAHKLIEEWVIENNIHLR